MIIEYADESAQTFALSKSIIPTKHLEIWRLVHTAQAKALETAQNGTLTADVDKAARDTIVNQGLGQYFTHRLGHGMF